MVIEVRQLSAGCKIEDKNQQISARIDGEGLWCTFRNQNAFYRRCMDGSVVMGADATPVSAEKAETIHRQFHQWVKNVPLRDESVIKSQKLSIDAYRRQVELYRQAYPEEVAILPPDRYGDIVIQPAIGCPNRKCTFCAFYKEKPYQVLNEQAFISHLQAIRHFYGQKLATAKGVFLGSANAMALSQRRLVFCLQQIKDSFGVFKREVATFADPDFSAKRTPENWLELKQYGLSCLVIGLETGWGELRASLGKSGDLSKVAAMIAGARQAGISVGLTVLTGAASEDKREINQLYTLAAIRGFNLSPADTVYLSPLSDRGEVKEEAVLEQKWFADALDNLSEGRVVSYQMQRFQYFT